MKKTKIAVIGGGLGSMSAIYHLLQLPDAREQYDITLYQTGWRLGGKGASGVNQQKGSRVEEHGIHFWFGFYENGFSMMRQVYDRLDRPPGVPLATFDDAFKGQPTMDFTQRIAEQWTDWQVTFPPLPGRVGDGLFLTPIEELFAIGFTLLADEIHRYMISHQGTYWHRVLHFFDHTLVRPRHSTPLEPLIQVIEQTFEKTAMHAVERYLRVIGKLLSVKENHSPTYTEYHSALLQQIRQWIWDLIGELTEEDPELLRIWCTLDFSLAVVHGLIVDNVVQLKDRQLTLNVACINEYNFIDWLVKNGADRRLIVNFPAVKSMYDGPFAFFRGAVSTPDVEAGTALNIFLRLVFTCKENVMFRMQAGMGDTIFAPLYELFRREFPDTVHFEFFSKVKNLRLAETSGADGQPSVVAIELERQVQLAAGRTHYDPLIDVRGLRCWPSEPLYDQLAPDQVAELKRLQAEAIGLESDWTPWTGRREVKTLHDDFDKVLIGASLSSLPFFCPELIGHNKRWARMLDQVGTVQTQAFQLWFNQTPAELGIGDQRVVSCYVEPLDTFAVMNQVLAREGWPDGRDKPKCLVYVCGAMLDSQNIPPITLSYFPASQRAKAFESAKAYVLQHLRHLMPGAFDEQGLFKWHLLAAPEDTIGEQRLAYQYFRANIDTSERYVFSLKGSSQYRLRADESGFDNVILTGDWIQNGLNIGFVEGAVISGMYAARALTGEEIPIFVPW